MSKKKKTYKKKYYTGGRVDMSKGGRVSYQQGGLEKTKRKLEGTTQDPKKRQPISIEREPITEQKPVQPQAQKQDFTKAPTTPKEPPMSIGGVGGGKEVPDEITSIERIPNEEDLERERLEEERRKAAEESAAQAASPEIMRETDPPGTTYTQTTEDGQVINIPDMATWEAQWLKNNPKPPTGGKAAGARRLKAWQDKFAAAKQAHQAEIDASFANTPLTTEQQTQAQAQADRRERIRETGLQIEAASTGQVPEGAIIPEAEEVSGAIRQRTTTMAEPTEARAFTAEAVAPEAVSTVDKVREGVLPPSFDAAGYDAFVSEQTADVQAALGNLSDESIAKVNEIRELSGPAEAARISENIANAAKAEDVNGVLSSGAFVPEVTGANVQVSATPDAERQEREAITGEAASGEAAQIIGQVGYEAAKQRAVKGTAAKGAAATMVAQTADIPQDIAAAIVEDPATVTAQVDTQPVNVQAAVAALPQEALVSSQLETLLGGMEDGEVPVWAKPAVDSVNAMLAQRGMSASTVGRDSLFNAIIQSSLPIAQSNAQALQQRATQNLSNQQQANLQQATQEQQLRMANLANRQTAESQTAQFAQQMGVMQSQFRQDAVMTTAQQQQQMRMQNLQNQQQAAVLNAQNQQSTNAQNLGNEQQVNLAELQIEAQVEGANQAAENQERLTEMQVAADFLSKNAAFKQDMERANLSNEQQIRLANLSALNQAGSENLSAAQQTELANLNKQMQLNIRNAELAQQMGLSQLNVDQQRAMQNASTVANMDMANFNADQQRVLANSKFMQTVALQNMNAEQQAIMQNATAMASLDMATADQRTKLAITNAQSFLQMDMSNLNNQQQANMMKAQQEQQRILSAESAENAARQFGAVNEQQTNQFMANLNAQMSQYNASQENAMSQFNATQENAAEARRAGREADIEKFNAQLTTQVDQFNSQQDFARNSWNAQNAAAVEASNVQWRRQANTINTAAQNQINMQNAMNAFGLSSQAMSFLWQELRDQADFDFRAFENEENRKAQIIATAIANEGKAGEKYDDYLNGLLATIGASYKAGIDIYSTTSTADRGR